MFVKVTVVICHYIHMQLTMEQYLIQLSEILHIHLQMVLIELCLKRIFCKLPHTIHHVSLCIQLHNYVHMYLLLIVILMLKRDFVTVATGWATYMVIPLKPYSNINNWECTVVKPQHIYGSYTYNWKRSHKHHKITS